MRTPNGVQEDGPIKSKPCPNGCSFFGESRIHLYCEHRMNSENSLLGFLRPYDGFLSYTLDNFQKYGRFSTLSRNNLYELWYEWCGGNNSRQLTHQADKFPALAGMAERVAETIGDEYLAGLWRKDLARGLMWSMTVDQKKLTPAGFRVAPISMRT